MRPPQEFLERRRKVKRFRARIAHAVMANPGLIAVAAKNHLICGRSLPPLFQPIHRMWTEILERGNSREIAAILTRDEHERLASSHPFSGLIENIRSVKVEGIVNPPTILGKAALEMALNASADVSGQNCFVVVGVGSLLAQPDGVVPESVLCTVDIDLWAAQQEVLPNMEEFDLQLGEGSLFHKAHGFYVERVGSWTVMDQPDGWRERCVEVKTSRGVQAACLCPLDLAVNKLMAGRQKDIECVRVLMDAMVVSRENLEELIGKIPNPHLRLEAVESLQATAKQSTCKP